MITYYVTVGLALELHVKSYHGFHEISSHCSLTVTRRLRISEGLWRRVLLRLPSKFCNTQRLSVCFVLLLVDSSLNRSSQRPHTFANENVVWIRSPYPDLDFPNLTGTSLSKVTCVITFSLKHDHSVQGYERNCVKNAIMSIAKHLYQDPEADDPKN